MLSVGRAHLWGSWSDVLGSLVFLALEGGSCCAGGSMCLPAAFLLFLKENLLLPKDFSKKMCFFLFLASCWPRVQTVCGLGGDIKEALEVASPSATAA